MNAIELKDRRLIAVAVVVGLIAADRVAAWLTGSEGWLAGLGRGGALVAFGIGHCDGMDGPVVTLARRALETGNANLVLPWVREQDEAEIRESFKHALAVRKLGGEPVVIPPEPEEDSLLVSVPILADSGLSPETTRGLDTIVGADTGTHVDTTKDTTSEGRDSIAAHKIPGSDTVTVPGKPTPRRRRPGS